MKRIRWNEEERSLVYKQMVELFKEGRYSSTENILRKAQMVLPADRRRKIYNSMLHKLKDWVHQAKMEAYVDVRNRKLTEAAIANKVAPPPEIKPQQPDLSLSELIEKLVDQLAKRVATEVLKDLSKHISTQSRTYQNNHPVLETNPVCVAQPQPPKIRRKTVTIIGLKGQQITSVLNKYADLDITCLTSDEAQGRSIINSDHTILMTKFIKHATHSKYRQVRNLQYCNGGVSDLCTIMHVIRNS